MSRNLPIWLAFAAWFFLAFLILSTGCGPAAREKIVEVPRPAKCAVPPPVLEPWPKFKVCGKQACVGPAPAHVIAANIERLLSYARAVKARCP